MIEYTHTIELIKNRIKQLEINQYNKFNFDKHLLEIDINSTNIINDFNQRQQELIQLINEDQHTFTKLEQRWQLIIKTILNKQQEIKDIIKLWLSYQNYLEKKIYEINRRLITYSDIKTKIILEKEWNDLQRSANKININIKQRSEILITLLIRYNELDHALDDVSISIKSIRTLQQQPTDELNQFILQCQSKDRKLTQHRHELQRLRQTITEISPELHPDDINQLMQKLNVLEIQWSDAERIIRTLIDNLTKK
ncbi:unnamed protein product, partial [Rotaria sordida]